MKSSFDLIWIAINICAHVTAAVLWKLSAQSPQYSTRQIVLFILGNLVGLVATFCLVAALKDNNPILIYAILVGWGAVVLNFTLWIAFRPPMSYWQWVGIGLIICGTWLLHPEPPANGSDPPSKPTQPPKVEPSG